MKARWGIILGALLAGPAMAQTNNDAVGRAVSSVTAPSAASFVQDAAQTDMFEIQTGKLALQRGNPATKKLAAQFVKDHQKTTVQLKDFIAKGVVKATLPKELSAGEKLMVLKLRNLQGDQFSINYVNDMENVHTQAIAEFNAYAQSGDNPTLKDWAAKTLPTLKQHRDMAGAMDMPH